MQLSIKLRSLFGKKVASTSGQNIPDNQISNWYRNINELPLKHFETCIVESNLAALVISGFPPPNELHNAWKNILSEYTDAVSDAEHKIYMSIFKEVSILKITVDQIRILISSLKKQYIPYFCDELRSILKVDYDLDPSKGMDKYLEQLKRCESRSKSIKIKLDLKRIEFESIEQKYNKGNVEQLPTSSYYTQMLVILSKHAGYRLTKDIFVSEYCEHIRQYKKHIEVMNKK